MPSSSTSIPAPQSESATREPISIVDGMLTLAVRHHGQRRLPEAERLYRRILAIHPRHAASLHALGKLARDVGRTEIAAQLIRAAIAIEPDQAVYSLSLGAILLSLGKLEEAVAVYTQALDCDQDCVEARTNLERIRLARNLAAPAAEQLAHFEAMTPKASG